MFASLKNKIKEETGDDVNRISSMIIATPGKIKGRHSRHGSTTSLGSFSIDGSKDEVIGVETKLADGRVLTPKDLKKLENKEDEWRKRLQKKDDEFCNQLKEKEESWRKKLCEKEKEMLKLLESKDNENRQLLLELESSKLKIKNLEHDASLKEEYKKKIFQYQEDIDQLESFQTQEIAKVKHLLLEKEQKLLETEKESERSKRQIKELTEEIRRLQQCNRELNDLEDRLGALRHKSDQEKSVLTTKLATEEENSRHMKDRLAVLEARCRAGCAGLGAELTIDERIQGLLGERALFERLLAEAHEHLSEVKTTWSEKISSLETQVGRLSRQASEEKDERRLVECSREELNRKVSELEGLLTATKVDVSQKDQKMTRITLERDDLVEQVKNLRIKLEGALLNNVDTSKSQDLISPKQSGLEENNVLTKALSDHKENSNRLLAQVAEMKDVFEAEKRFNEQLQSDVGRERREKDAMMLRNAEISQEVELVRKDLRNQKKEAIELQSKIDEMVNELKNKDENLSSERAEKDELLQRLRNIESDKSAISEKDSVINDLEAQLTERNKTIKSLNVKMNDMKKTLQREFNVPSRSIDPGGQNGAGIIPPHGPALLTPSCPDDLDVNFKYLKHVLFKFLTSREYEAQHLIRAVSTLLRFTAEEERLLKETMDWKMSWFGSRPKIGNSTMTKAIPPS